MCTVCGVCIAWVECVLSVPFSGDACLCLQPSVSCVCVESVLSVC